MTIALTIVTILFSVPVFLFQTFRVGFIAAITKCWKMITRAALAGLVLDTLMFITYIIYTFKTFN